MPECSRRHKCFAERVFPGGVVSNENENGSNGKYPTSPASARLQCCICMSTRALSKALACFDMSQRLSCFRVRLLACFASLYLTS